MNVILGRLGLRSEARARTTVLSVSGILALVASTVYGSVNLWHLANTTVFEWLNGCVDQSAGLAWLRESSYQPSPEYSSCVAGVHHAATIEASLAVGLLVCGIAYVIILMTEEFVNDYVVPLDGSPGRVYRLNALRAGVGIAAIVLAAIAVFLVFPVS